MEKVLKIYKTLSQTPILTGAKYLDNAIITFWTQRNIETGKNIKYMRTHYNNNNTYVDSYPVDISQESLITFSGTRKAVLREQTNGKEPKKQYLEIWSNGFLSNSVDLGALNLHGDVYTDVDFKSWSFSPDGTKILYIAEKKLPKFEPFYKRRPDKPDANGDSQAILGEEYNYRQDWGEQLVGKVGSVIAVYDIECDSVKILDGMPEEICPGQVLWNPDGSSIFGVGLETLPRKLGLVYCSNRKGWIFKLDFNGNYGEFLVTLSNENLAVTSPTCSPDGKYVLWLERDMGGPHQGCMRLMKIETGNKEAEPEIVIDIVENESLTCNNQRFYGLYNIKFIENCWASHNRLVVSTYQRNTIKTYIINIETNTIFEIKYENGSQSILDIHNDVLLVKRENYLQVGQCLKATMPSVGKEENLEWLPVTPVVEIELLKGKKYEFMDLRHDTDESVRNFTAIYFGPASGSNKSTPLIIWPHGGPHSSYFATFALEPSVYLSLGFAVLFINFRGSIGQGESSVNFLLGRIGTADVKDCVLAAKEALKRYSWLDDNRLALIGGSHGGFLVHHLSGQYPNMFKVVVSRNPVVDVAVMSQISDIPDWCAIEAGGCFTQAGEIDNDLFLKMRHVSPIQHAHKIKAPTFLMLGNKDCRVPCYQGLELYHRLKANGVTVKANMYEDNHPLAQLPHEMDHIVNGALWILEHLNIE